MRYGEAPFYADTPLADPADPFLPLPPRTLTLIQLNFAAHRWKATDALG